jgi:hypothetical protein
MQKRALSQRAAKRNLVVDPSGGRYLQTGPIREAVQALRELWTIDLFRRDTRNVRVSIATSTRCANLADWQIHCLYDSSNLFACLYAI